MWPSKPEVLISPTVWHITTIPTANLGFSISASSQKVSTSDYNIEQQPKIAIWPPKPEIVIPLELQQIASKFQRQVRDFRSWRARIKCRQMSATMTDNRKWQCGPKTGNTYSSGTMTDRMTWMTIPAANLRHSPTPSAKSWNFDNICQNSRDVIISGFGAISIFPVVGRCCTCQHYFTPTHGLKR